MPIEVDESGGSNSRVGRGFQGENGKIRADRLAIMAIHAKIGLLYCRRMIALGVKARRKLEHIPWAVLDAVAAPFAAVFYNVDDPLGYEDFFGVEGKAPEFHRLCDP
jgi:hypothetical protein